MITITKLREKVPDISIRTSLIVGFPGETEKQFEELAPSIQEYPLDDIGIFKFTRDLDLMLITSPTKFLKKLKISVIINIMKLQKKTLKKLNKKWIGKKLPVVVEGYHPETKLLMCGRHRGQCPEIDGQIIINDTRRVKAFGQIYPVEITDFADYDLIGRVL